jgi:hypothetical protein
MLSPCRICKICACRRASSGRFSSTDADHSRATAQEEQQRPPVSGWSFWWPSWLLGRLNTFRHEKGDVQARVSIWLFFFSDEINTALSPSSKFWAQMVPWSILTLPRFAQDTQRLLLVGFARFIRCTIILHKRKLLNKVHNG